MPPTIHIPGYQSDGTRQHISVVNAGIDQQAEAYKVVDGGAC